MGRFGASGSWRHLFQCGAPGCLLVYREARTRDNETGGPDTGDASDHQDLTGGAEALRGLQVCLPPPAVLAPPEGDGRLRLALESAGYVLGPEDRSRTFLVTDALLRHDRPRDLLHAFRARVGVEGLLILHLPRYENVSMALSLFARARFRPEYVSYFSFYSLMNLLWRTGFLAEEWFLDEAAHCMTIRAVSRAVVPPLTGDWEADRDRPGSRHGQP